MRERVRDYSVDSRHMGFDLNGTGFDCNAMDFERYAKASECSAGSAAGSTFSGSDFANFLHARSELFFAALLRRMVVDAAFQ